MRSGVYQIKNTINGKYYIGSTINIAARWRSHINHLNKNQHHSIKLQNAWNKYGADAFVFEIIEEIISPLNSNKEYILSREQYYLDAMLVNYSYNICKIAGSTLGKKHSEITKKKLSGEGAPSVKLNTKQVIEILELAVFQNLSNITIAKKYNINPQSVANILKGRSWTNIKVNDQIQRFINKIKTTRRPCSKDLTKDQIEQIHLLNDQGFSQTEIAKLIGCSSATISRRLIK
jgi:group I intron endonuclease